MSECLLCNIASVIEEEENGKVHHVCIECGHIVEECAILAPDAPLENSSGNGKAKIYSGDHNTHSKWNKNKEWVPQGIQIGCKFIKNIAKMFKFRAEMTESAVQLYLKVYKEKIRCCKMDTKQVLCICCIYVTARENDYAITLRDLDRFLDLDKGVQKFGTLLKLLKTEYSIQVKEISPALEAYNLLSKVKFPLDLIKKTQRILHLIQELWLISGRSRTLVIIATAFIAWKCADPLKNKGKLSSFCRQFSFQYTRSLSERKDEIFSVLHTLASHIPWIRHDEIKVEYHLDEILEFQQSLKYTAISAAVCEFNLEVKKDDDSRSILQHVEEYGPFLPPSAKRQKGSKSHYTTDSESSGSKCLRDKANRDAIFSTDNDDEHLDLGSEDETDDYIIQDEKLKLCKLKHLQEYTSA